MTDPHVHCGACHLMIETQTVAEDGTVTDFKPPTGTQHMPVPTPQGIGIAPITVYLCETCNAEITARAAAPKILVPGGLRSVPQ